MSFPSVEAFLRRLKSSGLVQEEQLSAVMSGLASRAAGRATDTAALARELVRTGLLTARDRDRLLASDDSISSVEDTLFGGAPPAAQRDEEVTWADLAADADSDSGSVDARDEDADALVSPTEGSTIVLSGPAIGPGAGDLHETVRIELPAHDALVERPESASASGSGTFVGEVSELSGPVGIVVKGEAPIDPFDPSGVMDELGRGGRGSPTMMGTLSQIGRAGGDSVFLETPEDKPATPVARDAEEDRKPRFEERIDADDAIGDDAAERPATATVDDTLILLEPARPAPNPPAAAGDSGVLTELGSHGTWRTTPTMLGSVSDIQRQSRTPVELDITDPASRTDITKKPDAGGAVPVRAAGDSGVMSELTGQSPSWRNPPTMLGRMSDEEREQMRPVDLVTTGSGIGLGTEPATSETPTPPSGSITLPVVTTVYVAANTPVPPLPAAPPASSGDSGIMTELSQGSQLRGTPTMMGSLSAIRRQSLSDVVIETPDEPAPPAGQKSPEPEPDDPHPFGEVQLSQGTPRAPETPGMAAGAPQSSGDSGIMTELNQSRQWRNTPTMMGSLSAIRRQSQTDVVLETPDDAAPSAAQTPPDSDPEESHPFGEVQLSTGQPPRSPDAPISLAPGAPQSSGDSGILTELSESQRSQWRATPTMMGSLSAIGRQSQTDVVIETPDDPAPPAAQKPAEPEPDDPHPFGEVPLFPGRSPRSARPAVEDSLPLSSAPSASQSSSDSGILTELSESQRSQWRGTPTMMGSLSAIGRQTQTDVVIETPDDPAPPAAKKPPAPEPDDANPFGDVLLAPRRPLRPSVEQTPVAAPPADSLEALVTSPADAQSPVVAPEEYEAHAGASDEEAEGESPALDEAEWNGEENASSDEDNDENEPPEGPSGGAPVVPPIPPVARVGQPPLSAGPMSSADASAQFTAFPEDQEHVIALDADSISAGETTTRAAAETVLETSVLETSVIETSAIEFAPQAEPVAASPVTAPVPSVAVPVEEPTAAAPPVVGGLMSQIRPRERREPAREGAAPRTPTAPRPVSAARPQFEPEPQVSFMARLVSFLATLTMFCLTVAVGIGAVWALRAMGTQFSEMLLILGSGVLMLVVMMVAVRPHGDARWR